jgi:hypothetical protein
MKRKALKIKQNTLFVYKRKQHVNKAETETTDTTTVYTTTVNTTGFNK